MRVIRCYPANANAGAGTGTRAATGDATGTVRNAIGTLRVLTVDEL